VARFLWAFRIFGNDLNPGTQLRGIEKSEKLLTNRSTVPVLGRKSCDMILQVNEEESDVRR
jgi:hypothetical protein